MAFHIAGIIPAVAPLLHAIISIAKTICLLMLLMVPIFLGFIMFFHVTLRDTDEVFDFYTGKSISKMIAMMLGNIEVTEFSINTGFLILSKCIST